MRTFLFWICLFQAMTGFSIAQSLVVSRVDHSAFPTVRADFFAFDKNNQQITGLNISDFKITENGLNRKVINVSCPPAKSPAPVSVALSMDASGSMTTIVDGSARLIDLCKLASDNLINAFSMPPSEMAILTCNEKAYINQDFTTDKNALHSAVSRISPGGNNDFAEQLLNPVTGLLNIAKTGRHNRVAILFSDAFWAALTPLELQRCMDTCDKYKIKFFSVLYSKVNIEPNGIRKSLEALASHTGGRLIEGILTKDDASGLALELQKIIQDIEPCTVEWLSAPECTEQHINARVEIPSLALSAPVSYTIDQSNLARLEFNPFKVFFVNIPPGTSRDTTIDVKAVNSDFNVTAVKPSNPNFSVTPQVFSLKTGQTQTLTVTYSAKDSSYNFCEFTIENDRCPSTFFASSGFIGKKPSNKTLKILTPNGGESFAVGSDTVITWTGISPDELVDIEYSTDKGLNWLTIDRGVSGLKYVWKNVPNTPSTTCLMRIMQKTGQTAETFRHFKKIDVKTPVYSMSWAKNSSSIAYGTGDDIEIRDIYTTQLTNKLNGNTKRVWSVDWDPAGEKLAAGCQDGMFHIWNVKMGGKFSIPLPGGPIFSVDWSPDGRFVAAAGSSGKVYIIDASTVTVFKEFQAHTSTVNSVRWSNDGSMIATASYDKTIHISKTSDWSLIKTLTGHYNWVTSIDWSPDGFLLASGSYDKSVRIWDFNSGNTNFNLTGHSDWISSLDFSPDGKKLASSSMDRTVKVWNSATGTLFQTLSSGKGWIRSVEWSPDGSMLACASEDNSVNIWTYNADYLQSDTSDNVWAIVLPSSSSHDIDMGKVIVGSLKDSLISDFIVNSSKFPIRVDSIVITDNASGEFKQTSGFAPFTIDPGETRMAGFSFMPPYIGKMQSVINIYTQYGIIKQNILGEGVVKRLLLNMPVIDFGSVPVNNSRDTVIKSLITNSGTVPVNITGIGFPGPNTTDFMLSSGAKDTSFTLRPGESCTITLRFRPSDIGRTSGQLAFNYNGTGSPAVVQLLGNGTGPDLALSDVEELSLNCESSGIIKINFLNPGALPLNVKSINITGTDKDDFSAPVQTFTLGPGENKDVDITFSPKTNGVKNAVLTVESNSFRNPSLSVNLKATKNSAGLTLAPDVIDIGYLLPGAAKDTTFTLRNIGNIPAAFSLSLPNDFVVSDNQRNLAAGESHDYPLHFNGRMAEQDINETIQVMDSVCNVIRTINLTGRIETQKTGKALLMTGNCVGRPGDTVEVVIYIKNPVDILRSHATAFKADLVCNASLLAPVDEPKGVVMDSIRVIPIEMPAMTNDNDIVLRKKFIAALGNDSVSYLKIENPVAVGGSVDIDTASGIFRLKGICYEGGARLVNPNSGFKYYMIEISPNPAGDAAQVTFQVTEKGNMKLYIMNYLGQTIDIIKEENSQPGSESVSINTSALPSGMYFIVLRSPGRTDIKKFEVVK